MKNLIKLILLAPLTFVASHSYGQFSAPDGNNEIHYSGSGVGVGISNPVAFFHVYENNSGVGTSSGITIEQDGTGDVLLQLLLTSTRRWQVGVDNSDNESFKISEGSGLGSNDFLTINTSGKVGIGINSPTRPLHLYSSTLDIVTKIESGDDNVYIELADPNTTDAKFVRRLGDDIRFYTAGSTRLTIDQNGKVGIGTIVPDEQLTIGVDNLKLTNGDIILGTEGNKIIYGTSGNDWLSYISGANGSSFNMTRSSTGGAELMLYSDNSNFRNARLEIGGNGLAGTVINNAGDSYFNGGNVGIGTNTPDSELAVNGTVHAKKFRADVSGWPDYVFGTTYQLRSLESTASFIKEHHHLPEIPAAAEMESNGMDVAEMNMILLKKIEEMTLHMIDMKQEIDALKDHVKSIKP